MHASIAPRLGTALALVLGIGGLASAQGAVHVVDASGGPGSAFTQIQDAVDAAADGDTLLVRPGLYDAFEVQAKGLVLAGDPAFEVSGGSRVRDLAAGQDFVISGMNVLTQADGPALRLTDNAAPVWIQSLQLLGGSPDLSGNGGHALDVSGCERVSVLYGILRGGAGGPFGLDILDGNGGSALRASSSTVLVQACGLIGGRGSDPVSGVVLGNGGAGIDVFGGTVVATDCTIDGGAGGLSGFVLGGNGGPGVRTGSGLAVLVACEVEGGPGGSGADGPDYAPDGGTIQLHGGAQRFGDLFFAPGAVREGQALGFQVQVDTGQQTFAAFASLSQQPVYLANLQTTVYPGAPLIHVPLGVTDFDGQLAGSLTAPMLPPGLDAITLYLQGLGVIDLGGGFLVPTVTAATAVTVLDASL